MSEESMSVMAASSAGMWFEEAFKKHTGLYCTVPVAAAIAIASHCYCQPLLLPAIAISIGCTL
jgi:hypothetical protein